MELAREGAAQKCIRPVYCKPALEAWITVALPTGLPASDVAFTTFGLILYLFSPSDSLALACGVLQWFDVRPPSCEDGLAAALCSPLCAEHSGTPI